jgi:hypothetical protein
MNGTSNVTHESWGHMLKSMATRGSIMESIGGIAVVILSIIGLAGSWQADVAAVSVVLIAASLLFECGTLTASYRRRLSNLGGSSARSSGLDGLVTFEFMAGIAGILLGVLALLGVATWTLISVGVIVLGCAFLLNSGATMRLHSKLASEVHTQEQSSEAPGDAMSPAGVGGHMLIALAAVVLGLLALLNISPVVLNLVALLALGVSVLLSGSFFGATRAMESKHV